MEISSPALVLYEGSRLHVGQSALHVHCLAIDWLMLSVKTSEDDASERASDKSCDGCNELFLRERSSDKTATPESHLHEHSVPVGSGTQCTLSMLCACFSLDTVLRACGSGGPTQQDGGGDDTPVCEQHPFVVANPVHPLEDGVCFSKGLGVGGVIALWANGVINGVAAGLVTSDGTSSAA